MKEKLIIIIGAIIMGAFVLTAPLPNGNTSENNKEIELQYYSAVVTEITSTEVVFAVGSEEYAFRHYNTELEVGDSITAVFTSEMEVVEVYYE